MDSVRHEEVELRSEKSDKNEKLLVIDVDVDTETRLKRNKQDERRAYRHRFLHTACVCFSMFALVCSFSYTSLQYHQSAT